MLQFFPEKYKKLGQNQTNFSKTKIYGATNNPELHHSSEMSCATLAQFKFLSFCLLRMTHSNPNQIKLGMMTIYKDNLWCSVINQSLYFIMYVLNMPKYSNPLYCISVFLNNSYFFETTSHWEILY